VLDEILATKRDEVTVLRRPDTRDLLRRTALAAPPTRGFAAALRAKPATVAVIAEIKRRSPSKGPLALDLDPVATARAYVSGGAAALSVLTDGPYFGGSMADLQHAREAVAVPVLRKDFVIDEVQVYEARAVGADAILLIVAAIPDDAVLRDLHELALELGLDVLVEVHDDGELERAVGIGARVLGVNSRSLQTFAEDLGVATGLRSAIPDEVVAVAESAIRSVADASAMADAGFDAVLVGEALVRADDPGALVEAMSACTRRRG
jgi:indole-3-glycerol phosphate synthase